MADGEITIAPLAKEAMTMGKLHKEIGQLVVKYAEDPEESNSQVILDVSRRLPLQRTLQPRSLAVRGDGHRPQLRTRARDGSLVTATHHRARHSFNLRLPKRH